MGMTALSRLRKTPLAVIRKFLYSRLSGRSGEGRVAGVVLRFSGPLAGVVAEIDAASELAPYSVEALDEGFVASEKLGFNLSRVREQVRGRSVGEQCLPR